jgi:hypothetical protein
MPFHPLLWIYLELGRPKKKIPNIPADQDRKIELCKPKMEENVGFCHRAQVQYSFGTIMLSPVALPPSAPLRMLND